MPSRAAASAVGATPSAAARDQRTSRNGLPRWRRGTPARRRRRTRQPRAHERRAASGPRGRGRTGGSGAAASTSASRSGAPAAPPTARRTGRPPGARAASRPGPQPAQRRRVGPVHVVDGEDHRAALARGHQEPDQPDGRGVHGVARRRGRGRIGVEHAARRGLPRRSSALQSRRPASGSKSWRATPKPPPVPSGPAQARRTTGSSPADGDVAAGSTCRARQAPRRRSRGPSPRARVVRAGGASSASSRPRCSSARTSVTVRRARACPEPAGSRGRDHDARASAPPAAIRIDGRREGHR